MSLKYKCLKCSILYLLQTENSIIQKFPAHIVYLNELLKRPEFCITDKNINWSFNVSSLKVENNSNK